MLSCGMRRPEMQPTALEKQRRLRATQWRLGCWLYLMDGLNSSELQWHMEVVAGQPAQTCQTLARALRGGVATSRLRRAMQALAS